MSKYRFAGIVVEVQRVGVSNHFENGQFVSEDRYQCLVRGFGHGSRAPHEHFTIYALSSAQAARDAYDNYLMIHPK